MQTLKLSHETSVALVLDILKTELETLNKFSFPFDEPHTTKSHEKDLKAFKRVISFYSDGCP